MHTGNFVQKKNSKGTLGIITDCAPVHGCWWVRWTKGDRRGESSIYRETELVTVEVTSKR